MGEKQYLGVPNRVALGVLDGDLRDEEVALDALAQLLDVGHHVRERLRRQLVERAPLAELRAVELALHRNKKKSTKNAKGENLGRVGVWHVMGKNGCECERNALGGRGGCRGGVGGVQGGCQGGV